MVPCWLMQSVPSGLRVLSYCCLIWTENILQSTEMFVKLIKLSKHSDAKSHFNAIFSSERRNTHTHMRLPGCEGMVMPSFVTSSPFTSCLYRLMTCVRLSLACKISAVNRKKAI